MSMPKAPYYKADGKKGRARELPAALFGGDVNKPVLHLVVKAPLANQRQGTAAAKTRAEVRGGGRKPWKQKGTGRARAGTTRAPHWTGGGIAFPPQPHSWRQAIPKKVKAVARRSALSARAADDRVILIDSLAFDTPSTRKLVKYLGGIGAQGKVLILTHGNNDAVVLSARNAPELVVHPFGEESVYDILWARTIVIERPALDESPESDAEEETDA
mgnify:CR=1 FL=1